VFEREVSSKAAPCELPATPVFSDATYYKNAFSVASDAAKLRSALTNIISVNPQYYTYACMWTVLEYTDEDPSNASNVILTYSQNSYPKV